MGGDLVEEEDGAAAGAFGDEIGMGEDEAEQQRLLLACRAEGGGLVLAEMGDGEIGAVRTSKGSPGGGVAGAARGEVADEIAAGPTFPSEAGENGRAACRESVWQDV